MKNPWIPILICFILFTLSLPLLGLYYNPPYPTVTFSGKDHIAFDDFQNTEFLTDTSHQKPVADLNTVSEQTLAVLPGMDEMLAKRVVTYRKNFGDFEKKQDIMKVNGITQEIYRQLHSYITVGD